MAYRYDYNKFCITPDEAIEALAYTHSIEMLVQIAVRHGIKYQKGAGRKKPLFSYNNLVELKKYVKNDNIKLYVPDEVRARYRYEVEDKPAKPVEPPKEEATPVIETIVVKEEPKAEPVDEPKKWMKLAEAAAVFFDKDIDEVLTEAVDLWKMTMLKNV